MSRFREENCAIPEIWCGKSNAIPNDKRYYKAGTKYECFQRGFGAGEAKQRSTTIPSTSLRNIKYVGEKMEKRFIEAGIDDLRDLILYIIDRPVGEISKFLKRVLVRSDRTVDYRAYNSTLLYLHKNGVEDLPPCKKLSR